MPLTIIKQLRPLRTLVLSECPQALVWHPQSLLLAAIPADSPAHLINPDSPQSQEVASPTPRTTAHAAAWAPDGTHLAIGQSDGTVHLTDFTTHHLSPRLGLSWVEHLAFSPDGAHLAASSGRTLNLLRCPDLKPSTEFTKLPSTPAGLAYRPKHNGQLLVARKDGIDSFATTQPPAPTSSPISPSKSYEYPVHLLNLVPSPNGKYAACGCQDNSLRFWELDTGDNLQMTGYPAKVKHLGWSPDSRSLHTIGLTILMTWDFSGKGPEGSVPTEVELHESPIGAFAVHPVTGLIATGDQEGILIVWKLDTGKVLPVQTQSGIPIVLTAWHPVQPWLAVGYENGTVELWHLPSGK